MNGTAVNTLGRSPAALANRDSVKPRYWCPPKPDIEFDVKCDPDNPKTIKYKSIIKACHDTTADIPETPLINSQHEYYWKNLQLNVYYKIETLHATGSFLERPALYCLKKLNHNQRSAGVITASNGNWGMALAYYGQKLCTPVTVVFPTFIALNIKQKCVDYGALVVVQGKDFSEAKLHAYTIKKDMTYINGYDHPLAIAASGVIGLEIVKQLPEVDAVLVPVGGGGLIAGIAAAVKHIKPEVLIYGVEPKNCNSFSKAIESGKPYNTDIQTGIARSLEVSQVGCNALHTAKPLIDKMIIVDDGLIARASLLLLEEQRLIVEGAGACSLGALLILPRLLRELQYKNVVCIITGGNVEALAYLPCTIKAKINEGRLVKLKVAFNTNDIKQKPTVLSVIANMGCNIVQSYTEKGSITENDFVKEFEDFDEFCDPDNPRLIKYEDVVEAMSRLKSGILLTPCTPSHLQRDFGINVYYKLEMLQKTGSFKERGALNALQQLPLDKQKIGIIIASIGNSAAGFCHQAAKLNIPVTVVMPNYVSIAKQQMCLSYGAKVVIHGGNMLECSRHAKAIARDRGLTYIHGRDHPHVLVGYGTVALEILEQVPTVDAVILPVGMGGLAAGVCAVIKHVKPQCLVYGVQAENMPCFYKSLQANEPTVIPMQSTIADAIGTLIVAVNSFFNAKSKLDKMLLVNEDLISRSILHLIEKERFVVEGSGACTLAAIIGNLVPELKTKTVVCILSGGNIDTIMLGRCIDRGLAAEGRLVKFKVGIKDKPEATAQLLNLLSKAGYNIIRTFPDRVWVEGDVYTVEMKLVCETKGLEHALELKRIIERAYPTTAVFETEPFNDKRTCPCYVMKSS